MNIVRKNVSNNWTNSPIPFQAHESRALQTIESITRQALGEYIRAKKQMEEPRQLTVTQEELDIVKSYADLNWPLCIPSSNADEFRSAKGFRLYGVEHIVNDKG